jgi:tetratricopeptide (TPR) repeat protein
MLSVAAVPVYLFTREMASRNRQMHARIGDYWYQRGQEALAANDVRAATESFRRAAASDHDNPEYRLVLARALAATGNTREAKLALLQLREATPESGEINLELARLSAPEGALQEAVRYYRNALYGVWPDAEILERRQAVRLELIGLLLENSEDSTALSELLLFSRDITDVPDEHLRAGALFLRAGDPARSLQHFARVLQVEPANADARAGAGEAAFRLGDYQTAERHLEAAAASQPISDERRRLLNLATLVVANDPLLERLPMARRRDRLLSAIARSTERLESCDADNAPAAALAAEKDALQPNLTLRNLQQDPELIRMGISLVYRIETTTEQMCGNSEDIDAALILIGLKYGLVEGNQTPR